MTYPAMTVTKQKAVGDAETACLALPIAQRASESSIATICSTAWRIGMVFTSDRHGSVRQV